MCTKDENLHLIDTKTYLSPLQHYVRDIVPLPMFCKWRQAGNIIGYTLEKPVGGRYCPSEAGGRLGSGDYSPRKSF